MPDVHTGSTISPTDMHEPRQQSIDLYTSLFRGRNDVYARYWEKNGRSGYSPAYSFNWGEFLRHKNAGGTIHTFEPKKCIPLTNERISTHLSGEQRIGIYPLLEDNTSYFIAVDFDKEGFREDAQNFVSLCKIYKIPTYIEVSASGNGAHAWIFFEDAYPAKKSRAIVLRLIRQLYGISDFQREVSFDRLFPNQDFHGKKNRKAFGNLIALPLNGELVKENKTVFVHPSTFRPYKDQWRYIAKIQKVSHTDLDKLYEKLVVSDAHTKATPKLTATRKKKHEGPKTVHIEVSDMVHITKDTIPSELRRFLTKELNFMNSEYLMKRRLGKSTYKIEQYFNLINDNDTHISIPRGFLPTLIRFLEERNMSFEYVDARIKYTDVTFEREITLYDYQVPVLESVKEHDTGVIVAPPNTGKTIIGLDIVRQKKQKALIIVHRKQLLEQWVERIQSFLEIPKKEIGHISGSKKVVGEHITVAMIQSLARMKDVSELRDAFGTIIIDECHHIPAKSFREAIVRFNAYYVYGLTATPRRKHNDEKLIFHYIGDIIHEIQPHEKKPNGNLVQTNLTIISTSFTIPFSIKVDDFHLLAKVMTFDTHRNKNIADVVKDCVKKGRKVLVLTDRKDHVRILNLYIKGYCETVMMTGDDSSPSRNSKLKQVQGGHFQVLIATGQLFGEGLDIDTLDTLVLAFPFSFEGKLIQYIGRIQRAQDESHIIDFRDEQVQFLENMFKKRFRYYKKAGLLGKKDKMVGFRVCLDQCISLK